MYTRLFEDLLVTALQENAVNTAVRLFDHFTSAYLEGMDDESGDIFNKYFPQASLTIKIKFVHNTPFRSVGQKLAKAYGLALPWKEVTPNPWEWVRNTIC